MSKVIRGDAHGRHHGRQQLIASNEYDLYRDHGTDSSYKYLFILLGTTAKR